LNLSKTRRHFFLSIKERKRNGCWRHTIFSFHACVVLTEWDGEIIPITQKKIVFRGCMMSHALLKDCGHFPYVGACLLHDNLFFFTFILVSKSIKTSQLSPDFNSTWTQAMLFQFSLYFTNNSSIESRISSNTSPIKAHYWEGIMKMEKKEIDAPHC
jgi:hypothetical protein